MTSTLKKIDKNKHELTVEVSKEELLSYITMAENKFADEVKIDGFRKGKAPREKVRQEVGDAVILQEALDAALQSSLSRAIEKEDLEVLKVTDLNIKENSANKLLYSVTVFTFPEVKIGELSQFKAKRKEVLVDRKEIDNALLEIAASRSKLEDRDKAIEVGDRVEIDFEVTSDGLPVEGGVSKNHPVIVGDKKFIPGFEDQLIGMKKGEEKNFSLHAPKDYGYKAIANKKLDFNVKITAVQEIIKPTVDNEFAKSLGRFENVAQLEQSVSQGLLQEKQLKEKQRLRVEILSGILEKSKLEVPDEMIEEKLKEMVESFDQELHAKGMELSMYLTHLNKTQDDLEKEWRPEAIKQVSFALILKKMAKTKNIDASQEEVQVKMNELLQMMASRGDIDKDKLNMNIIKENVYNSLVNEKVFEFLEKNYAD